jgi:hypothetical protein
MASIRKRTWTGADNEIQTRWVCDYFDQNRKRHLKTFKLKKDAEEWLHSTIGEVKAGVHIPGSGRGENIPRDLPKFTVSVLSGIYFLYDGEECVYVGKSLYIHRRILQHINEGAKVFDSYRYKAYKPEELYEMEQRFIAKLNIPKYNGGERTTVRRRSIRKPIEETPVIETKTETETFDEVEVKTTAKKLAAELTEIKKKTRSERLKRLETLKSNQPAVNGSETNIERISRLRNEGLI